MIAAVLRDPRRRSGAIKLAMQLAQLALPGTVVVLEGAVVIASLPVQPGRNDLEELEQWRYDATDAMNAMR